MVRQAYVNGRYLPHDEARVHVEDRGFQFADGVYEVIAVNEGLFLDMAGHMNRLNRSLKELQIAWPKPPRVVELIMRELVRRNRIETGTIYIQITRGRAPRDFRFPERPSGTLVITTRRLTQFGSPAHLAEGVAVITVPDIRWQRRDIKTVGLLPQVLGKQKAHEAGCFEAWQVDPDGRVTEGCSSNAWIIGVDGVLVTRKASHEILNGITRQSILQIAEQLGISLQVRPFTVEEAYAAREAFISSASSFVTPVTRIDGRPIGDGRPGPLGQRLRAAYLDLTEKAPA